MCKIHTAPQPRAAPSAAAAPRRPLQHNSRQRMLLNLANTGPEASLSKSLLSMMITSLLNLKHCLFKSHDTCALCDHSKPRAFLSFLNVFECCYRTRHQAFLLRTKREVSSDKRVQKCKHQLDSIRRLIKNGRNRYTCGVSSVAQQRGMAYSAERIGSEQHALDSKKRHTEKDDLQRKTKRMKNHKQKQEGWCKDVSPWQPETQNARSNKQSVQGDQ